MKVCARACSLTWTSNQDDTPPFERATSVYINKNHFEGVRGRGSNHFFSPTINFNRALLYIKRTVRKRPFWQYEMYFAIEVHLRELRAIL